MVSYAYNQNLCSVHCRCGTFADRRYSGAADSCRKLNFHSSSRSKARHRGEAHASAGGEIGRNLHFENRACSARAEDPVAKN